MRNMRERLTVEPILFGMIDRLLIAGRNISTPVFVCGCHIMRMKAAPYRLQEKAKAYRYVTVCVRFRWHIQPIHKQ